VYARVYAQIIGVVLLLGIALAWFVGGERPART